MKRYLILLSSMMLFLAACQALIVSPAPAADVTPAPEETQTPKVTEVTVFPDPTATSAPTASPTATTRPVTATPVNTPTRAPSSTPTAAPAVPPADIEIDAPGALSKVVSPIPVRAMLEPGEKGRVTVELLGEDGRVISRQIVILNPNLGRKVGMVLELPFEISSEVEFSRLVISTQDEFGRTTALASKDLVLLASGQPDFNVVVDLLAPVAIQEPQNNAIIQGDSVVVSGLARPAVTTDYVVELIAQNGKVISQRIFNVSATDPSTHVPFIIEVPFTLEDPTWVLLLIRERGDRIPGITYLTSMEVLLSP